MSPDWKLIKDSFNAALDLADAERATFIDSLPATIAAEVVELLRSHESLDNFIDTPAPVELGLAAPSLVGTEIGPYRLLELVGSGGMGSVYRAEKRDIGRGFAVKLIKRGMDSDAVLKRFELERRILARLQHPNIARLLDGGTTADGLPYFVMEFVDGVPLTRYCRERALDFRARLEIFRQIFSAVAFAHRNLVIHRDLKPSNILVTVDGIPKLLDFGIAKLLDPDELEDSPTITQMRAFTPEYASPEQLSGLPVTTASDVYSLGVCLYEILSGRRPFDSANRGPDEVANLIRTHEPPRPSTARGNSDETSFSTSKLQSHLAGDLDNIILKSVRREPERRYQTVTEFAEDIERFLDGRPVSATADSLFYRLSKFVHRHRQATIAVALAGILIVSASGAAIWQGIVANRERIKAQRRFEDVRRLANVVLFEYHDGISQLPGATAMREKMVRDSLEFLDNLSAESSDDPVLRREVAEAYRKVGDILGSSDTGNLGRTQESLAAYVKAKSILESVVTGTNADSEDRLKLASLLLDIGMQKRSLGDIQGAEVDMRSALGSLSDLPDSPKKQNTLAKTYWNIAMLRNAANDFDESLENFGLAVEIYERLALDDSTNKFHLRNAALTHKNIAAVLQIRRRFDDALIHLRKSEAIDRESAATEPNDVSAQLDYSFTLGMIGSVLQDLNDSGGAIAQLRGAVEIRRRVFAADPKNKFAQSALASGLVGLGRVLLSASRTGDARETFESARSNYQALVESDKANHSKTMKLAECQSLLAYTVGLGGRESESEALYKLAFGAYSEAFGKGTLTALEKRAYAGASLGFGEILLKFGRNADAGRQLERARELFSDEKIAKDSVAEIEKLNRLQSKLADK